MHLRTARRLGLVGLTTLALALPATTSVAASEKTSPRASFSAATVDEPTTDTPDISKMTFSSTATHTSDGAYVIGQVTSTGDIDSAQTEVRVNGRLKGRAEIYYNTQTDDFGVVYKAGWGAGKVVLGPTHITTSTGEEYTDSTTSNTFRIRYGVNPNAYYTAGRTKNKISLKAVRFTMYKKTKYVSMGRTIVQVKTSKGWKDKKVLKLAGNGNSPTYTFKVSGKKYYRFKVTTTDERLGFVSEVYHA